MTLKMPKINIAKVSLLIAVLIWLALLFVDITRIFGELNQLGTGIIPEYSYILEILFFISVYIFYNETINSNQNIEFLDLIWRGASTGLLACSGSLVIRGLYYLLGDGRLADDPLLNNFFYHVNFALITLFLMSTAILWRRLILYQKTKRIVQQWQAFEVLLLISMFIIFFNNNSLDYSFLFGLVFLVIFSISLSINLKWIPYLTFKEKWKSILFLTIILLCAVYLFFQLLSYSDSTQIFVNLTDNLFLISLFGFIFIYSLFSLLVTLFNLPTSSVFEQKLTEAINFQRLSQSIKPGQSEHQVLDILIDSCMSASYADAGWIEILDPNLGSQVVHRRFIKESDRNKIQNHLESIHPFSDFQWDNPKNEFKIYQGKVNQGGYLSGLILPLVTNQQTFGRIFLLKEVKDGFNKEMLSIISTFVGQASISVENHRLLNEAIKNERYKEELKIAQRVQRSLLPNKLHHDESFIICGFSEAADEVGGDYYETHQMSKHEFAVIIGDVSGKGTSAAFNMSQMKGVFQSLVQIQPSPREFMIKANKALSICLERQLFITSTYLIINTLKNTIKFSRAGHCPTLYFDSKLKRCEYLKLDGMGLGIIRTDQYESYVHEKTISFNSKDIMVLYTDGLVEASNDNREEFGYDRLQQLVEIHQDREPIEIQKLIIKSVFEFIGPNQVLEDDYSLMVIKFV